MKRSRQSSSSEDTTGSDKRRKVGYTTFLKWKSEMDRECQTVSWLECETEVQAGKKTVSKLKCKVCHKYQRKLTGLRNFSYRWITGAESVRNSNIRDHARSDQHEQAMNWLKRDRAIASNAPVSSYAPVVQAMCTISEEEKEQLRCKFDIAYFLTVEKLPFRKYPRLCELEKRHGVSIGNSYTNEIAGKSFCHFSAQVQRQQVVSKIVESHFFSLLIDASMDKAIVDNEIFMAVWCDVNAGDEMIHTRTSYFHVGRPSAATSSGLFQSLTIALQQLGITQVDAQNCSKLVGIGSDGAASNIASGGLKGLVEARLEWVFWMWCLAHRLELAVKDALQGTWFTDIDDMLLKLYYLYEKSPKKCRELEGVISDLNDCISFGDGGSRPIRASGSRWVSHKLNAMKRILSKYGAYTNHLVALSVDSSVKSTVRAKLKGYCNRWTNAKYVLGCAVYVDLLTPSAIFSKTMQSDELDILAALTSLLRTIKETEKLKLLPLEKWPTYSATMKNITEEDGQKVYQCQELKRFNEAEMHFSAHYGEYCTQITDCLRTRMQWSDMDLIRDIISTLAVQGWEKILEEESSIDFIDRLVHKFSTPLHGAQIDVTKIKEEFEFILQYAVQYLTLATLDYHAVWWRIFHAPTATEWTNALTLIKFSSYFSLPASKLMAN